MNHVPAPSPATTPARLTVRRGLLLAIALPGLLASLVLMTASVTVTGEIAGDMVRPLMAATVRDAEMRLQELFAPINDRLLGDYAAIRQGVARADTAESIRDQLLPGMYALPQVGSAMLGDSHGRQVLVMRYDAAARDSALLQPIADSLPVPAPNALQYFTREVRPEEWGERSVWTLWSVDLSRVVHRWELPLPGYDPRTRPWHELAMQHFRDLPIEEALARPADLIAWTDAYPLFTTKTPGISATVAARHPDGRISIVAYDLLLDEIAKFTRAAAPTKGGQVIVMTEDGRLIGPPRGATDNATLPVVAVAGPPVWQQALGQWRLDHDGAPAQFRLRAEGSTWWLGVESFSAGPDRTLWVGVLLPESDLVPWWHRSRMAALVVALASLGLAVALALRLARWVSQPLGALAEQSARIARLNLDEAPAVRSHFGEIDTLARALPAMRDALRNHIGERRRVEQALRDSEARYRTLIESAIYGIIVHQDGTVRFANRAAAKIFGVTEPAAMIGSVRWHDLVEPDQRAAIRTWALDTLERGTSAEHPGWQVRLPDGSRRWLQVSLARITWEGRDAVIASLRDITALRAATDRQAELEGQLRQAQKLEAVGLLAGGVAHDFNNLLQVIGGNAMLALLPDCLPEDRDAYLQEINDAVKRAAAMTRQLLAFSRRQPLRREYVDLNQLVAGLVSLVRRMLPENIRLENQAANEPLFVHADKAQLEQVLLNLCVNARDAMPQGGVLTFRLSAVRAPSGQRVVPEVSGALAQVIVADTGVGMDAATLGRIFEPFFSTKPREQGTGLGLAVAYGIIQQHRGHIEARSQPGEGAEFTIQLPLESAPPHSAESVRPTESHEGQGTVLVAEDDERVRRLAARIIARAGFRVIEASDGEDACRQFAAYSHEIDLLFFDVMMPGLNGFEAARRCRQQRPGVPLLFASGYAADSVTAEAEVPADARLLSKPYSTADLIVHLRELIRRPDAKS